VTPAEIAADTSNPIRPIRLTSMGRKIIVIGKAESEAALRRINMRLMGRHEPQRCTCPTDHGWH
jgi:hypothetical protein